MGKRIIIIDNRQSRAQNWMKERWDTLCNLHPNLTCVDSITDCDDLSSYDVIAVHGSYVTEHNYGERFHNLEKDKYVVYFSGGFSIVRLENEHLLKIPAIQFYSSHLIPFCSYVLNLADDEEVNLSMLVYGVEHWRIPQLIKLRDLVWRFPDENTRPNWVDREETRLMNKLSVTSLDIDTLSTVINQELLSL